MYRILAVLIVLFLSACGGGSGGSSGSGGQGVTPTPANVLTVSSSSVNFSVQQYGDVPTTKTVNVTWTDSRVAALTVGYPPNVAQVDWLDVSATSGLSPITLSFSPMTSDVSVGSNPTTIRVAATDTAGAVINYRDIAVVYDVAERPMLSIDGNADYTFYAVAGGMQTQTQTVKTSGEGVGWYSSTDQNWLYSDTSSNTAPADFGIAVNPQGLEAGRYTGKVTLVDERVDSRRAVVNVTAEIQAALILSGSNEVNFEFVDGQSNVETQMVSFSGSDVNWTASADEAWVTLDTTSGTGNGVLNVGVDTAALTTGEYTATLTIADTDSNFNQSLDVLITAKVEPRMISAERRGVALTSTPSLSNTSTSFKINDNSGENIAWSALSDAAWLAVTPSGQTGTDVTLTANGSGLAVDTLHMANVTINSSDSFAKNTEVVKVGFWVGASAPNATDTITGVFDEIITDPVRPYAYVHKGGSQIEVYNIHTAAVIATISSTSVARAGDMAISHDGATLYVYDETNQNVGEINLETYADVKSWDTGQVDRITYGRVDNRPFLFASNGAMIDLTSGDDYSLNLRFYDTFDGNLDVSRNGEKLCGINSGTSPYSLDCYRLKYSYLNEGNLDFTHIGGVAHGSGSNGSDVAVTPDGSHVYAASGAPYVFLRFDAETMQKDQELPADAYPNNVELGSDGLLYGGISGSYGPLDAWIYNANGVEQSSYYLSGYADEILRRQLVVSGDAMRMIALTSDPKMEFVTVK